MEGPDEDSLLRSVALQNAQSILAARLRADDALLQAQAELRESRELLRSALGAAGAGVFRWRADVDELVLGENVLALLGPPTAAPRAPLADLAQRFAAADGERLQAQFHAAARDDGSVYDEFRLADASDGERWFEVRGRLLASEDPSGRWLVGTITDVSLRKRQEAALQAGDELVRATFEQATVGIAIATLDGRFETVNDRFLQILGYERESFAGLSARDITHPDDRARTDANLVRLIAGEIAQYQMEKRYLRADGALVWSHTTVAPLRDAQGKVRRFIGIIDDITERRSAERALAEETRVLETLNQTNAVLASQLELDALLQKVTDAATELSGAQFGAFFYNGTDEQGAAMMLYTLSGAPRSAFENFGQPRPTPVFAPTFHGEGILRVDDIHADPRYGQWGPHYGMPSGHLPVRSYLAVPVQSPRGEVIGGLFFGHPDVGVFTARAERIVAGVAAQAAIAIDNARLYEDVRRAAAEREHLLEAERAARSQAERAGLMKDEFLSTLSHELRTPLNAVLGWAQILLSRPGDAEIQKRGADTIARNAKAQAQLIDDLLDMNRIVSGKVRLDVQPTWLEVIIDAALDAVRPSAEAKGIRLVKVVAADAGPVTGDPTRLQQVVWNLLSNAVKFTDRRGVVTVRLARVDSNVELVVSDNGMGIAPDFLPFVFDRFRQADASTTRTVGGLGLGLAIVKQLIELHGGSVEAFSKGQGEGAHFRVTLPLSPVLGQVAPDAVQARTLLPATTLSREVNLEGLSVLVVDDEPDGSAMVAFALGDNGALVTTAGSADEALEQLRAQPYDLLVSDIGMPNKDGYQLIRELRSDKNHPANEVPAIALTAFARTEDRTQAMLAGYQVHLAKPVEPRELVATVGSLLGRFAAR